MQYFLLILILVPWIYTGCTETQYSTRQDLEIQEVQAKEKKNSDIKILDGDTFVYQGEHIRLIGINTPEIKHKDKKAQCGAYKSMQRLEYYLTRIRVGPPLITRAGTDKYGRTLAVIHINHNTQSINSYLVEDGYATTFQPEDGVQAPSYDLEYSKAKRNGVGLHGECPYFK